MKKTVLILLFLSLFSLNVNADIINPRIKTACIDKTGKIVVCPKDNIQSNEVSLTPYRELVMTKDECISQFEEKIEKANKENKYPNELKIQQANCHDKYLMGFKDKDGKIVIKPQYDLLLNYSEGLAGACLNGKCGYIDEKGKWAIEPQDISFMCYSQRNDGVYWHNYKCKGSSQFSEGLASVRYDNNTKSGYIDKKGKVVLENIESGGAFSQGLAPARKENLFGYINKKGEFIIKPQFYEAGSFDKEGFARVKIDKSPKELNIEYKESVEQYTKFINERINEAKTKEEKQKLKKNLEDFKKYSKQDYNIKSDNGFMDNYAYGDIVINNDKPHEAERTGIIFSIALFFLIVVAGVSIKRTVKNNAEH